MTWRLAVAIPGQPLSWNASYRIGRVTRVGRRGQVRLGSDGEPFEARTILKTEAAKAYTNETASRVNSALQGRRLDVSGFIVVEYRYFLGRDIDCDNVMKLVDDGVELALGVDDKWLLPRAMSKVTGLRPPERRLELTLYPVGFE